MGIERMVNDAKKFKAEDEAQKERVSAKNELESYAFQMKQTVEDDKVKDKISDEERKQICEACDEAIKWLDGNQMAEKDEFNHQKKELEKVCTPIITICTRVPAVECPAVCPTWVAPQPVVTLLALLL